MLDADRVPLAIEKEERAASAVEHSSAEALHGIRSAAYGDPKKQVESASKLPGDKDAPAQAKLAAGGTLADLRITETFPAPRSCALAADTTREACDKTSAPELKPAATDAEVLTRELNAIYFSDKSKVMQILERHSETELKELDAQFKAINNGKSIEDALKDIKESKISKWSNADLDRALNELKFDYGKDSDRQASLLHEINTRLTDGSSKTAEKAIREQLGHLTEKNIKELSAAYAKNYDGHDLLNDLKINPNISEATKQALEILMKGSDKRETKDRVDLANIAVKGKDLAMFQEALGKTNGTKDLNAQAREQFLDNGGHESIVKAFTESKIALTDTEAINYPGQTVVNAQADNFLTVAYKGEFDTAAQIRLNNSLAGSNESVELAIRGMTEEQKYQYLYGKQIEQNYNSRASENDKASYLQGLSSNQKEDLKVYKEINEALSNADSIRNGNFLNHIDRWESMISGQYSGQDSAPSEGNRRPSRGPEEEFQDSLREFVTVESGISRGGTDVQLNQAVHNNSQALDEATANFASQPEEVQNAMRKQLADALKTYREVSENTANLSFATLNALEAALMGPGVIVVGAITKILTNKTLTASDYEILSVAGLKDLTIGGINTIGAVCGSAELQQLLAVAGAKSFAREMLVRGVGNGISTLATTDFANAIGKWDGKDPAELANLMRSEASNAFKAAAVSFGFSCAGSYINAVMHGWRPGKNSANYGEEHPGVYQSSNPFNELASQSRNPARVAGEGGMHRVGEERITLKRKENTKPDPYRSVDRTPDQSSEILVIPPAPYGSAMVQPN